MNNLAVEKTKRACWDSLSDLADGVVEPRLIGTFIACLLDLDKRMSSFEARLAYVPIINRGNTPQDRSQIYSSVWRPEVDNP